MRCPDLPRNRLRDTAAIAQGLAAHEVVGLDRRGAFVDGKNPCVTVILGRAGFLDEAHAAVHLHPQAGNLDPHFSAVALDERHQEFVENLILPADLLILVVMRHVVGRGAHHGHGAAAFDVSTHGHEHAAHIGMVNDGGAGLDAAIYRTALHPLPGIGHGLLVGTLGNRYALHSDGIACRVHHDEHVFEAAIFLPHQITGGAGRCRRIAARPWARP